MQDDSKFSGHGDDRTSMATGFGQLHPMVAEIRADMAAQLARLQEREANGELAPIPKSLE